MAWRDNNRRTWRMKLLALQACPECGTWSAPWGGRDQMTAESQNTDPTVIVNEADLPGLRMPGEYDVTYDRDAGTVTIESGPEAGTVVQPNPRVIDAIDRAVPGSVVRDTVDRYEDAGEADGRVS